MEPVKRLGKSASKQPTVCVNGTRSDLTKAFGSQQAKRAVERREKLKFDVENAKASIESALTGKELMSFTFFKLTIIFFSKQN